MYCYIINNVLHLSLTQLTDRLKITSLLSGVWALCSVLRKQATGKTGNIAVCTFHNICIIPDRQWKRKSPPTNLFSQGEHYTTYLLILEAMLVSYSFLWRLGVALLTFFILCKNSLISFLDPSSACISICPGGCPNAHVPSCFFWWICPSSTLRNSLYLILKHCISPSSFIYTRCIRFKITSQEMHKADTQKWWHWEAFLWYDLSVHILRVGTCYMIHVNSLQVSCTLVSALLLLFSIVVLILVDTVDMAVASSQEDWLCPWFCGGVVQR